MKVIDEKPDPSVVKTVVCSNCGVKLEYVPDDVKTLWSGTDISGGPDGAEGFECPRCRHAIVLCRW